GPASHANTQTIWTSAAGMPKGRRTRVILNSTSGSEYFAPYPAPPASELPPRAAAPTGAKNPPIVTTGGRRQLGRALARLSRKDRVPLCSRRGVRRLGSAGLLASGIHRSDPSQLRSEEHTSELQSRE